LGTHDVKMKKSSSVGGAHRKSPWKSWFREVRSLLELEGCVWWKHTPTIHVGFANVDMELQIRGRVHPLGVLYNRARKGIWRKEISKEERGKRSFGQGTFARSKDLGYKEAV